MSAVARPRPSVTSRAGSHPVRPRCCSAPGRNVFVKAVGAELNPDSPDIHRREAVVSAALPRSHLFPRLLDVYDDGAWVALAFEAIDGRPPRHPWDAGELAAAAEALVALHEALTPSPSATVAPASERLRRHLRRLVGAGRGQPGSGGARTLGARATWCVSPTWSRGGRQPRKERRCCTVTCARTTCSSGPDGVVFVDWPHAAVGAPVLDVVTGRPRSLWRAGPSPTSSLPDTRGPVAPTPRP